MISEIKKISIIGDGGWGTTLAVYLNRKHYAVTLWSAFSENIEHIRATGFNAKFLPNIPIPPDIHLTANLSGAITGTDLIVLTVPTQYLADVLKKFKRLDYTRIPFVSAIKGIDTKNLLRVSQIVRRHLGAVSFAVLSGPTIAKEVALGIPSTAVIASHDAGLAKRLQGVFNSDSFRIYTNNDVVGVEMGGSLKNVIALACGVCDGLGYGSNTKAAILSRGMVEMSRLGKAMGGKAKTFAGLAGLGDLVTTCTSPDSRNRYVGEQLGKGKSIQDITSSMAMVAEGVATTQAAYKLSRKFKVPMPITEEVYNIIYRGKKPLDAVACLMTRKTKAE